MVIVNDIPVTPTITSDGPTTFCDGGSVILTSGAGTSYLWSNGASTQSINITTSGSYTVKVANASGCQSAASVATVVTVNALPGTPTISADGPTTFCDGGSVTLTSSAGTSYLWSNGASTPDINVTTAGNYAVQVTNASGCQSLLSTATVVTVNALPATPTITDNGSTTFCDGGSVTLSSSAGSTYLWSNGATTASINITSSGSYAVQVTNAGGCQSVLSTATVVTVNALPATPTITPDGATTFCDGTSINLTSSSGTVYLWSNGATTQSINITSSGSYAVQVGNASGCQSATSVATIVTVNALPTTPAITAESPTTFCNGGGVTLTSSPGTDYLWSNGATTQSVNITTTGSYTVQVYNASGCQSATSVATVVTVNALPLITASNNGPVCAGSTLDLTGGPAGMTLYYWTGPDNFTSLLQNPSVSDSATLDMAGHYTLTVANANGCTNTATQSIIVNETPIADAGPDQDLKFDFETQMNAVLSASETGEWSLTSGSGHISDIHSPTTGVTELSPGENKFLWKVVNGNCENTAEVKITVHDLFVPSVITPNGDGKNDYFKISEFTGIVDLIILNRWGNEEYTKANYLNDWNGRNNKGAELPGDTYFYILKFENGRIKKGSVLIKR
jgi:gliding motility-associated-like protein